MKVAMGIITTLYLFIFGWVFTMLQAQENKLDTLEIQFQEEKTARLLLDQKLNFTTEKILDILKQKFPKEEAKADTNVRNNINNHAEAKIETLIVYELPPSPYEQPIDSN